MPVLLVLGRLGLLVLRVLVRESLSRPVCSTISDHFRDPFVKFRGYLRREFSQLVTDHVLGYPHIVVDLAVVHLEDEADKVGEDGCAAGLRLDRGCTLSSFRADNRETTVILCQNLGSFCSSKLPWCRDGTLVNAREKDPGGLVNTHGTI